MSRESLDVQLSNAIPPNTETFHNYLPPSYVLLRVINGYTKVTRDKEIFGHPFLLPLSPKLKCKQLYWILFALNVRSQMQLLKEPLEEIEEFDFKGSLLTVFKYAKNLLSIRSKVKKFIEEYDDPEDSCSCRKSDLFEAEKAFIDAKFPFVLRTTKRLGDVCCVCRSQAKCEGCILPFDNSSVLSHYKKKPKMYTVLVEWDPRIIVEDFLQAMSSVVPSLSTITAVEREKNLEKTSIEFLLRNANAGGALSSSHIWRCPHCHEYQHAITKTQIWNTPNVLMFHLQRFLKANNNFTKLTTKVSIPLELDIAKYIGDEKAFADQVVHEDKYRLIGAIFEEDGYKDAYLCGKDWYFSSGRRFDPERFESSEDAYILIYERTEHKSKEGDAIPYWETESQIESDRTETSEEFASVTEESS